MTGIFYPVCQIPIFSKKSYSLLSKFNEYNLFIHRRDIIEFPRHYIVDESANVTKVVLDYDIFKKIEEVLLDTGLVKAMEVVEEDEELRNH